MAFRFIDIFLDTQLSDPAFVAEMLSTGWLAPHGEAQQSVYDRWRQTYAADLKADVAVIRCALQHLADAYEHAASIVRV
jgi:hypothetical protein